MVFQDDGAAGDSGGFAQENRRIIGVMQDVDEQGDVKTVVRVGDCVPVEFLHRNPGLFADEHINALSSQVRSLFAKRAGQSSVAAADVENADILRNDFAQMPGENADASIEDVAVVNARDGIHLIGV